MSETARTVVIEGFGGPEVLQLRDLPVGEPGPGELRIRHQACGLNFIDVYQRTGLYPLALPHALGMEAAGIVEAVGEGVTHLKPGDRAAYAATPPGAYAQARVMPAAQVCPLPDEISFDQAAAMMLKGLTVDYLFHRTTPLSRGDTVLFHAAAGGVGLIACQWAKAEGITLIGTAGSDEKCALAKAHGATHVINYRTENFTDRVRELTDGKGVDVVMDSIGADTFEGSLDCLKPLGMMISFGNASGPVPPVNIGMLGQKGSLKLTRPTLFTHISDHAACQAMARRLFGKVTGGEVKIRIDQRFPLDQVADAHRALEARQTTGSTILEL
ncbi:quinone oxidoreductase [Ruegeria pomeroyi]|uniref:Quinone oxidoreductase, putative n=2 Tax=Ruegeria pomeroyi TaxID=89184 RepID=Q5LX26_RUEPO|nr:quinone oxidoreductase [Ruegeria pomeroyi]HCE72423.1 quinone oxidoreductase [Ruegeria sp.]AAV93557.1 quinone oxidoreductase, putative [Ruegeria pomeroyi DSS-3]NVK96621.1 quinone oxidoreductase [Ruegeria pomeroyi]NVL02217.1 quinone oxidoreductase [Ruegeria pomeroyi]QWV10845.1 quinone oxidoreductase [Ruegeria pomeroyi]